MIECLLGHSGIFYSPRAYAKHLVEQHDKVPLELIRWAREFQRKEKAKTTKRRKCQ